MHCQSLAWLAVCMLFRPEIVVPDAASAALSASFREIAGRISLDARDSLRPAWLVAPSGVYIDPSICAVETWELVSDVAADPIEPADGAATSTVCIRSTRRVAAENECRARARGSYSTIEAARIGVAINSPSVRSPETSGICKPIPCPSPSVRLPLPFTPKMPRTYYSATPSCTSLRLVHCTVGSDSIAMASATLLSSTLGSVP